MANNKSIIDDYYEFDMSDFKEYSSVDDMFYLKDLKQRKLFLRDEINAFTVESIIKHILQINREDFGFTYKERKPILLYISSNGGDVSAGFELIDVILNSKTPVYTVNLGNQYSMSFLIGLAGHKRFATEHSTFLSHDGSNMVYGTGNKVQDQMDFQKKVEERIKEYVTKRTNITTEMYQEKARTEWYMYADEAKELGIVDYIIGKDIGIEAII